MGDTLTDIVKKRVAWLGNISWKSLIEISSYRNFLLHQTIWQLTAAFASGNFSGNVWCNKISMARDLH